ncbi:MAG: DNA translocase FtsK 4TM domain-containing protein, partial [Planctomycetia bacterium]
MAYVDRRFGQTIPTSPAQAGPRFCGSRAGAPTTPSAESLPLDRVRDLTALALLAGCVFLVAALVTFDPADPPASRVFPPHARATNACGFLGSIVASALYASFGLGAWLVVVFLGTFDVMLLRRRPLPDLALRTVGAVIATCGGCSLMAMFLPDAVARPVWGPGGYVGATGSMFAEMYLATAGAAIVVTALTGAGLFLAADTAVIRLINWATAAACLLAVGIGNVGSGLAALDRFPGLRRRLAGDTPAGLDDTDDSSPITAGDDDTDDASGPAIRVKRREPPMIETVAEDTAEESDASEETDDIDSGDVDEPEAEPAVPIKSLVMRRKKPEPLELAPDPVADYELPGLDLLLPTEYLELDQQEQEVRDRARVLEKTFAEFGFKVKVVEIETGPVISQYEIELEAGLRLAKITNLADDLAIALRVPSVRIVAPIPGKNSVGIEVPNTTRQMVRLREVIEETQAKSRTMKIPIYLGKDVAGNPMVMDMASMPHLFIAGRTGTGKSVCLNSIIVSMLMTRRPD